MRRTRILQIFIIIIAIILIATACLFIKPYTNYKNHICNTDLMGYETEGVKYSDLNALFQSKMIYNIDELQLNGIITYDFSDIEEQLINISFAQYLKKDYSLIGMHPTCYIDEELLDKAIDDYNETKTSSVDASWTIEDNRFIIIPERIGTRIDKSEFTEFLNDYLYNYSYLTEDITMLAFYEQPNITAEYLTPIIEKANQYASWSVGYENGVKYTVDAEKYITIDEDYNIIIDNSFIKDIARDVAKHYDSVGQGVNFRTTGGEDLVVKGGTWGRTVSEKEEIKFLEYAFEETESWSELEPHWGVYKPDEIGDTYVEVSKDEQHLWVYEKGELVLECDVVTGTQGVHDTPVGAYYITECINGKYLIGADYKTWVNKWMRLTNRGIGLHDAYWRKAFGGKIYQSSGSHGCINMPPKAAATLYDKSYVGMPVIIY